MDSVYRLYIATAPDGAAKQWLEVGMHKNFAIIYRYARFFNCWFFHTKITDEDKNIIFRLLGNMHQLAAIKSIDKYIAEVVKHIEEVDRT